MSEKSTKRERHVTAYGKGQEPDRELLFIK